MPNWCMNTLTVEHDDPTKLQEFVDAYNSGSTCEHYLPVPKNEQGEIITDQDSPLYWYTWCIDNWGTKWDFGLEEYGEPAKVEDNKVVVSFNSAWGPPVGLYDALYDLNYNVDATYFEAGMGFCGFYRDNQDHYIEYSDHDEIPHTIWETYGLAQFFEEEEEV